MTRVCEPGRAPIRREAFGRRYNWSQQKHACESCSEASRRTRGACEDTDTGGVHESSLAVALQHAAHVVPAESDALLVLLLQAGPTKEREGAGGGARGEGREGRERDEGGEARRGIEENEKEIKSDERDKVKRERDKVSSALAPPRNGSKGTILRTA